MASSAPSGAIDAAARKAILDAARAPVEARLGIPVRFKVDRLTRIGDDVFLLASMLDEHGRALPFAGTPLEEAAHEGAVSHVYAALLRKSDGGWTVLTQAIGPTGVAWAGWSATYGVAPALFGS